MSEKESGREVKLAAEPAEAEIEYYAPPPQQPPQPQLSARERHSAKQTSARERHSARNRLRSKAEYYGTALLARPLVRHLPHLRTAECA